VFLTFWLGWALVGLAAATWLFAWAVRSRQFDEARRAALLPFDDVTPQRPSFSRKGRLHLAALLTILGLGIALTLISLVLALVPR